MAATSPYTPNDYRAVSNYRPYELPINDIYKAIDAQDRFWKAGAANVKNVYENALNLDLTLNSNIELRKNFMEQAQQQLNKLSTMDLSLPSVQRQGFGIFKPLLQDKGIMYDDYLTKKYKEVVNDADHWKNDEKTKGEGFSMDNLAYALRSFKGFNTNTSREQLEGIYNSAKNAEYTPYYDVSKERLALLDKCKPDQYSNSTPQGMYMETEKVSSLSSQKLWGCLEAGLSDKARQQMRISGAVRYGDDYETLKKEYISTAQEKRNYYGEQIKDLSAQKAALVGKKGYEKFVEGLQSQIDQYNDGVRKLDKDLTEYGTWNDDYMKKNYEDLAAMAYFKRANGAFAEAFARRDVEHNKKADPAAMLLYTQEKLDKRQLKGFAHDEALEDYKFRQKLLSGDGSVDDATRLRLLAKYGADEATLESIYGKAEEEKGTAFDALKSAIEAANTNLAGKAKEIVEFAQKDRDLANVVGSSTNPSDLVKNLPKLESYLRTALKTDPNDVKALELRAGMNAFMQLLNEKTHKQAILDDAQSYTEQQVDKQFRGRQTELNDELSKINNGQSFPITLWRDGKDYKNVIVLHKTPAQVIDDIQNGRATLSKDRALAGSYRINYGTYSIEFDKGSFGVDKVGAKEMRGPIREIFSYLDKNEETQQKITDFKNKTLNTYLENNTAVQKMKFAAGNVLGSGKIDEKMTPSMKFVSSVFGTTLGDVKFNTVGGFDPVTGWTDVQAVDNKGKSISGDKLREAAASSSFGTGAFEESKYPNALRVRIPYLTGILAKPQYSETINDLMNYAAKKVTSENLPQGLVLEAGYTPSGNKIQIKTTKSLASGAAKYTVLINGIETPVKIGNDAASAMNYINSLITGQEAVEIK